MADSSNVPTNPTPRRRVLTGAAIAAVVGIAAVATWASRAESTTAASPSQRAPQTSKSTKATAAPRPAKFNVDSPYPAPEFTRLANWVNSAPLTLADLRGKVVIVNFWTFGCSNCQATIPHLKDLYAKYHDQGLEIVGLHAPEFDYEKDAANVRAAVAEDGITWPVAQDNAFATWRRYKNGYWPAFFVIDKTGRVRQTHIGEGGYPNRDAVVAALLRE